MTSVSSAEAQKHNNPVALVRNKKITVLLVFAALVSFSIGSWGWIDVREATKNNGKLQWYLIYMGIEYTFLVIRPSGIWFLSIVPFIVGALILAAVFVRPLSRRPYVGLVVALPILALVGFLGVFLYDSHTFYTEAIKGEYEYLKTNLKIFSSALLSFFSVVLLGAAMAVALGFKIRAIAPFRERMY